MASNLCIFLILICVASTALAVEEEGVTFFLYNQENKETPIVFTNESIPDGDFFDRSYHSYKILCHGYTGDSNSSWIKPTVDAYLAYGERNIIVIDWGIYAAEFYPFAVLHAQMIAHVVGQTLIDLSDKHNLPIEEFHLIGHSLGAHVLGFSAQHINNMNNKGHKIGRITGLDPAGPAFNDKPLNERLSVDDANFVDIIHTSTVFLGYKTSIGHVDFWPNGGSNQDGCDAISGCSHNRAPLYFIESINSTNFPAWYCDSKESFNDGLCFDNIMIFMGEFASNFVRGNFYLNTNEQQPFGKVDY